jgi:hypothetical protein
VAVACVTAIVGGRQVQASPITPGDLVVVRLNAAGSNAASAVFLDEFTPGGVLVQSIAVPSIGGGGNQPLTMTGNAASEGFLSLATSGDALLFGGYGVTPGTANPSGLASNPRSIGRMALSGAVFVRLLDAGALTGSVRSVCSTNGVDAWAGTSDGVQYAAGLGTTAVLLSPANARVVGMLGGQLSMSSADGAVGAMSAIGVGMPTTSGQSTAPLAGFPAGASQSAYDYFLAGESTLYVADDSTIIGGNGGVQKWTLSGGVWSRQYVLSVGLTAGVRGLTGYVGASGRAVLFATTADATAKLVTATDTGAGSAFSQLWTAPSGQAYRGIRRVPAAFVIDGIADEAGYGPALAVQQAPTTFGDSTTGSPACANGSELDRAFGTISGGVLYLHLAGNLEANANHLCIFIDAGPGGQNPLRGDNDGGDSLAHLGANGGNGAWGGAGLTFDSDFSPDWCLAVNATCSPSLTLATDFFNLPSASGGVRTFLGSTTAARGNGSLAGGINPGGIRVGIDNSNVAGVDGTSAANAASADRGVEIAIPLAAIGNPASVKVCVLIADGNFDGLSNQALGSLSASAASAVHGSTRNFQSDPDAAGNQYFVLAVPCTGVSIPAGGQPAAIAECANAAAMFSVAPAGDLPFTYQWRRDGVPIADGAQYVGTQTATLSVLPGHAGGGFDCVVTNCAGAHSATSVAATLASIAAPAAPASTSVDHDNFCPGSLPTVHVSAVGGLGASFGWYTDEVGGTLIANSTEADIAAPTSTITIWARYDSAGCMGAGTPLTIHVKSPASSFTVGSGGTICAGGSITLAATPSNGDVIDWYVNGCGGTLAGSGSELVVNPALTTTYAARSRNPVSGCVNAACQTIVVTVRQPPSAQAGSAATIGACSGPYRLSGSVSNAAGILWTTNGSGTFDDPTLAQATYTLGQSDIAVGQVTLTLTAQPIAPCVTAPATSTVTITIARPSTVFVNGSWAGLPSGTTVTAEGQPRTVGCDAFGTIQMGIDAVALGGEVRVAPGAYAENLIIDHALSLRGANAGVCATGGASRGPESVLRPPSGSSALTDLLVYVKADGVSIDGFTLDGDNLAPGGQVVGSGLADVGGIVGNGCFDDAVNRPFVHVSGVTISNNILRHANDIAVNLYNPEASPVSDGNAITCNAFGELGGQNTLSPGGPFTRVCVLAYNDTYAQIEANTFDSFSIGVQVGNNRRAKTAGGSAVSSNTFTRFDDLAVWLTLQYQNASTWTIGSNTIAADPGAVVGGSTGIYVSSIEDAADVVVSNNTVGRCDSGVRFWNTPSTAVLTVTGGLFHHNNYGFQLTNRDAFYGPGAPSTVKLVGVQCTNNVVEGIVVLDDPSGGPSTHLFVEGCVCTGNGLGGTAIFGSHAGMTIRNAPSTLTGNAYGVYATHGGSLLMEDADLRGNAYSGIQIGGGTRVDAGDCSGSNYSTLGTGHGANGSSHGGNNLGGYVFDDGQPWAITNLNVGGVYAYAQNNDFGAGSFGNIDDVIFDHEDAGVFAPVLFSQIGGQGIAVQPIGQAVCPGGPATFSVVALGATHYQWYLGAVPVGGDLPTYTVPIAGPSDAGVYTVVVTDACGHTTTSVAASLSLLSVPVAPDGVAASPGGYCVSAAPATITLSATGGWGTALVWYAGSCNGTPIGVGTVLTGVPAPGATTTYFGRWTTACGSSACVSVTVVVSAAPAPPSVGAGGPVCIGTGFTLTGMAGVGETIDWFTGACGGTLAGTGASVVVSPSVTTTYYAQARNTTTGCVSSGCGSVVVTVNTPPNAPVVASAIEVCAGASATLSGTVGVGETIDWYAGSCAGAPVGSGLSIAVVPTSTTTYYARARRTDTGCVSATCASVAVSVHQPPGTPALGAVGAICDGSSVMLAGTVGVGETIDWFTGSCGGSPAGTGLSITVSPNATTLYYARARDTRTGCVGASCASVTVTVNNTPRPPTIGPVPPICDGLSTTLSGTAGLSEIIEWFAGSCSGLPIGTGGSIVVTPATTTTYYARARNPDTLCVSPSCASVTVTVNTRPGAPTIGSGGSVCAGQPFTLTAAPGTDEAVDWFADSCAGTAVGTGSTVSVVPTATTTYFARTRNTVTGCIGATCSSVTVEVVPMPTPPAVATVDTPALCRESASSNIVLTAMGGTGGTVRWYSGSCGGTPVGVGSPLTIPAPSVSTTYFARREDGACSSPGCVSVAVTVSVTPVAPTGAGVDRPSFCEGAAADITLTASGGSGDTLRWYSGSCGGTPVGVGTPLTIPAPSVSTTYLARWESGVCGGSACVGVSVRVDPPAHAPTGIDSSANSYCAGSVAALTLTAIGGSGDTVEWFEGSCDSAPIGTGDPLAITAPSVTKTYLARWMSVVCGPSGCVQTTITVNPTTGACCTGWGSGKVCNVVDPANCAGPRSPVLAYRGDCTTCAAAFCCPSDFDNNGSIAVQDIFDFLAAWFAQSPAADFNGSGTANVQDIFDFLNAWFVGCH